MTRVKKINTELGLNENVGEWNSRDDRWSRRAKHQLSHADLKNAEEIVKLPVFEKDESVLYQGKEVLVQVPNGPNDTSGVIVEGHLKMVHRSKLSKLDEGVLGGLMGLNPINRMMQLAGLESGPSALKPGLVEDTLDESQYTSISDFIHRLIFHKTELGTDKNQALLQVCDELLQAIALMKNQFPPNEQLNQIFSQVTKLSLFFNKLASQHRDFIK